MFVSLKCHEIRWQLLYVGPSNLLQCFEPRNCQIMRAAAELIDRADAWVYQLEGIGLRWVFSQFNRPSVEWGYLAWFSFEIRSFASKIWIIQKIICRIYRVPWSLTLWKTLVENKLRSWPKSAANIVAKKPQLVFVHPSRQSFSVHTPESSCSPAASQGCWWLMSLCSHHRRE